MAKKESKNTGISRIDSGSTHGWFVRGYRNGEVYSKLFSDRKFKNSEEAHEQARRHRDKLFAELKKIPLKPRGRRLVYKDARNTTGVLGVNRTVKKNNVTGKTIECYQVSWRPAPGVQKCTSFSIRKYGVTKAFQLAVAFRRQKLKEIYGPGIFRKLSVRQNIAFKKANAES